MALGKLSWDRITAPQASPSKILRCSKSSGQTSLSLRQSCARIGSNLAPAGTGQSASLLMDIASWPSRNRRTSNTNLESANPSRTRATARTGLVVCSNMRTGSWLNCAGITTCTPFKFCCTVIPISFSRQRDPNSWVGPPRSIHPSTEDCQCSERYKRRLNRWSK